MSRCISVSIEIRLRVGRPGLIYRQGQLWTFFRHRIQTGSETHPASYPLGTGGFFPGS